MYSAWWGIGYEELAEQGKTAFEICADCRKPKMPPELREVKGRRICFDCAMVSLHNLENLLQSLNEEVKEK